MAFICTAQYRRNQASSLVAGRQASPTRHRPSEDRKKLYRHEKLQQNWRRNEPTAGPGWAELIWAVLVFRNLYNMKDGWDMAWSERQTSVVVSSAYIYRKNLEQTFGPEKKNHMRQKPGTVSSLWKPTPQCRVGLVWNVDGQIFSKAPWKNDKMIKTACFIHIFFQKCWVKNIQFCSWFSVRQ